VDQGEKVEKVIRTPSELPIGWKKAPLIEIAEIIMGQSPPSEYYNTNGEGLPFFQGKAEFGDLYPEPIKWCSEPSKVAQKDDILISVRAPVGPTNLAPNECCIGRGLAAIRPRDGIPSKYLLYYLRNIETSLDELGTGTTFKAISGKVLHSISVPVAPPEQQKRIVAEIEKQFSRLDEAVANLKRVKANLKRYKAAVLKAAVEGKLTEEWRKTHPDVEPASEFLNRILTERRAKWSGKGNYKEPEGPDLALLPPIPASWVWATVESLSTKVVDGVHKKPNYVPTGIPFVTVRNLTAGPGISFADLNCVTETDHGGFIKRANPERGDILVSKDGTLGVIRVVETTEPFSIFVSVALVKPVLRSMSKYFALTLQSPQVQFQMVPKGSGLQHIHLEDLRQDCVPLPPIKEQLSIVAEVERRLSMVEKLDSALDINFQCTNHFRKSVLRRAFSGRLVRYNGK
jgi:type I restriction enzyme S subunit